MQPHDLVTMIREGSNVRRCHTLPHHGEYTVGKHSYDSVMLLLILNPEASANLIKAVLVHDLGERWCGDVPAPAKWSDGELAKRHEALENRCLQAIGLNILLDAQERKWLSAVDTIELLLWAKDQIALGNLNVTPMIGNIMSHLKHVNLPESAAEFIRNHKWTRTPDQIPK